MIENEKMTLEKLYSNLYLNVTLGADPEIFVENGKGNIIPAFKILGSKEEPSKTAKGNYGEQKLYWDGFAAEFTPTAQNCLSWLCDSTQCGLKGTEELAKKRYKSARLSTKTVIHIPESVLEKEKEEHVILGCMPSFNVYDLVGKVRDFRKTTVRSAGGHIHFGTTITTPDIAIRIVKALDAIIGVAAVSMFEGYDVAERREYYGLAGEYRLPQHGLEYRVLSNAWLFHPVIMNLIFDIARKAFVVGYKDYGYLWNATEQEIIDTINNNDVSKAREILERNKLMFLTLLNAAYARTAPEIERLYKCFLEGIDSFIKDPKDIAGNWDFDKTWKTHCDGEKRNVKFSIKYLMNGEKI